ncbi:putative hypoxanthine oxidase XdhD [Orchesella cincta]|uniref:Putative hypoxanthine oxidase XdhD n=1 Tax=Orchesella cincta TaxID=48709 RepID=A0A1D2MYJ2_ORCCI|nr:putative hypoxanthine oxidase XdhD [Orchesella cincta]
MSGYINFMRNLNLDDLKPDPILMSDPSMFDRSREIFGETLLNTFDMMSQVKKEADQVGFERLKILDICYDLKETRYYVLLERIYSRLQIVASKEWILCYEIDQIRDFCLANMRRLNCPKFVAWAKKKENIVRANQEAIRLNRLVSQKNVAAQRFKKKWESVKEDLNFEIAECLRLAEELRTRYNDDNESKKPCKKSKKSNRKSKK